MVEGATVDGATVRGATVESATVDRGPHPGAASTAPLADDIDPVQFEHLLREKMAHDTDPTAAVLALAGLLCDLERIEEALAELTAACARQDGPDLRVARAGVLRDLGRRHEACAELRALVEQHGAAAVHPGLLFERCELELLEGDQDAASRALQELVRVHAGSPWVTSMQPRLEALAVAIASPEAPRLVQVRDLLGNLRGATLPTARVAALERLAGSTPPTTDAEANLHEQAIAIALADPVPALRARALELARLAPAVMRELVLAALEDPAALVRGAAADRAGSTLGPEDQPTLRARLAAETDEFAFVRLHAALRAIDPNWPPLPPGAAATAAGRAAAAGGGS
ncbi:MAG: hypothetical protein MUC36_25985 [Planctomycetes bacterium]|nr:hypothetical protein [Planctomycetota bacterium]